MSNHWLEVIDVDKLINFSRKIVYYNFDETTEHLNDKDFFDAIEKIDIKSKTSQKMNRLLPLKECRNMFLPLCVKKNNKGQKSSFFVIKENDYDDFLIQLNHRMISNMIKDLVKRGALESAFDAEIDDFVFWVKKNDGEQDEQKPETD